MDECPRSLILKYFCEVYSIWVDITGWSVPLWGWLGDAYYYFRENARSELDRGNGLERPVRKLVQFGYVFLITQIAIGSLGAELESTSPEVQTKSFCDTMVSPLL
jgi:hypothetical protein